ncbi:MAG: thermonuclease family protein [Candidatus Omnitrophica bacterium]|nr:thermonuclease family protein [Candidatus Omnitrophota bacterium]
MVKVQKTLNIHSYSLLRDKVRQTLLLGQQRIEQEKVRTYWHTGKIIDEYIWRNTPKGKERAAYNKQIVERLAGDLDVDESLLYRCVRFNQHFKKVAARQLSWAHFRALLAVPDEKARLQLAERAENQEWTSRELETEVKKFNMSFHKLNNSEWVKKTPELLTPIKGEVYAYRLVKHEKLHLGKINLRVDLGFSNYREAAMKGAENLKAGDIALSEWVSGDTYRLVKAPGKTAANLFTYYAYIERVVDGDTLLVQVDLGFGEWTRQYLRLRGINAPEMDTPEGKQAKKFVESELEIVPYIVIASTKSDKYDRYLADVFYKHKNGEQFLNNRLLEERLAIRV